MRWNLGLAGLSLSWGLVAVLAGALDVGSVPLTFLRLAIAAATLALVAAVTGRSRLLGPGSHLLGLVALGCIQAVHWCLFFETVRRGSVALAVITFAAAPVFLAVLAPLVLSERLSNVALGALVPGVVGIALVARAGTGAQSFGWGALACGIGSALTFSVLLVLSKRLLHAGARPLTVAFWDCLVGGAALAPALLLVAGPRPTRGAEWAGVLLLGAVLTGLATLAYEVLLRHVTAQTAGILTFLEPVSALILAWWLLDQSLTPRALVGAALVLCATAGVVTLEAGEGGIRDAASTIEYVE
ncbi:MAG: DMT family transporter [Thermoleophilia bacterium]|nr:DMT family transporter [Thermoleophilia bacterium]